ncbi:MAG: Holliday junction resolvase RuvX [Spirochaetes bacterium]|nr:Holliday junction resolvase RuvX [Spirochaetota bacterium]
MILGIDFGKKRIGTALLNPGTTIPYPHEVVYFKSKAQVIERLLAIIARDKVTTVVFGMPYMHDGSENEWCAEIRWYGAIIAKEAKVSVVYADERCTSVEANQILHGKQKYRKAEVDRLAAVLILEEYLNQIRKQAKSSAPETQQP